MRVIFSCHSNERLFLRDFVSCSAGTSGGRLARWLQPDSFVDPSQCEALYSREEMRCGWPAIVTVLTRDQYGEVVHVPGLKVFLLLGSLTMRSTASVSYDMSRRKSFCRLKSKRCRPIKRISWIPIRAERSVASLKQTL